MPYGCAVEYLHVKAFEGWMMCGQGRLGEDLALRG